MKIEKMSIKTCCGGKASIYKLDTTVSKNMLDIFKTNGFRESEVFTKSGMLYADNEDIVLTGTFGSDKIQIKCRNNKTCEQALINLENILNSIG